MSTLPLNRRFYAEELRAVAGIRSDALVEAFATVPREAFLGPGPWQVVWGDAGHVTGSFDAIFINAGATHPRTEWLDALAPGGRLILPLTTYLPGMNYGSGFVMKVRTRTGATQRASSRRWQFTTAPVLATRR